MIEYPNNSLLMQPEFIDPDQPTGLWWCQNAEDMMAVSINAVCKSMSAEWRDLDAWVEWVAQFPYIMVCIPPGPAQDEALAEIQARFPVPIMLPNKESFRGFSSIKELRDDGGLKVMDRLLLNADEVCAQGILNLADVDCAKRRNAPRVSSGIMGLDRAIGGFSPAELSVWTGKRGEGKSTLLGQILLEAVNQGHNVCAYSGELPKEQFKLALLQQAAGYLHVEAVEDPRTGKQFFIVPEEITAAIDRWWDKHLFLTDIQSKDAHDERNIMRVFEYAYRRYGCDVFLLDNVMTAELKDEAQIGYWRAQSAFTGRLAAFCKRLNVHVHLVAHPRKVDRKGPLEADDVGGSGDITNRADNVFKVERVPEDKAQSEGYSTLLTVLKNREFGTRERVQLEFNTPSRRFFQMGGSPTKRYKWERGM